MRKRIILVENGKALFEACLEDVDKRKVICREKGEAELETIGRLIVNNYKNFNLLEVIKITPIVK